MESAKLEKYKITIGDTYEETFLFSDYDNNKMDLSVYDNIQMDIRKGITTDNELLYSVFLNSGITISNINQLDINISALITTNWKGGTYYRDVKFINGEQIQTLVHGEIIVRENITDL